jgi:hypothetical protein
MSSAERQRRYIERLKGKAEAAADDPFDAPLKEVVEYIFSELGVAKAKRVVRALDKRLKAIKPDCPACKGTGMAPLEFRGPCGTKEGAFSLPCDCGERAEAWLQQGKEWAAEAAAGQQCKVKEEKD